MTSVSFICPTTQPGIMFSFLKKKPAPAAVSEFGSLNSGFDKSSGFDENGGGTALGRSAPKPLRHHRALVGQLKHDHAVLVDIYTRIATAGEKGDWRSVEIEIGYFESKRRTRLGNLIGNIVITPFALVADAIIMPIAAVAVVGDSITGKGRLQPNAE